MTCDTSYFYLLGSIDTISTVILNIIKFINLGVRDIEIALL